MKTLRAHVLAGLLLVAATGLACSGNRLVSADTSGAPGVRESVGAERGRARSTRVRARRGRRGPRISSPGPSWGEHSLRLELPAASVCLTGLSAAQRTSLKKSYSGFVAATTAATGAHDIDCRAHRLERPTALPPAELNWHGQYALRKTRLPGGGIGLSGFEFEARFDPEAPGVRASIGVSREGDLAAAPVIENFLRVVAAHRILRRGGALLHSAGLVFDGRAYVFPGYSNVGKTTLTRKAHAQGARVLSDDINLVLPDREGQGYSAFAVPFTGEFGRTLDHRGGRDRYPLAGIVLLQQGERLETGGPSRSAALARLMACCPFVNTDEEESANLFESLTALMQQVPVVELRSRRADGIDAIMAAVRSQIERKPVAQQDA